jgi:uncharacterized protein (TIGR03067 family)
MREMGIWKSSRAFVFIFLLGDPAMKASLRMILTAGFCLAGISLLAAVDDAKQDAIKKDRKKYEGTWRVTSLEINGNKSSEEDAKKIAVVNKADGTWILQVDGGKITEGTSEIDPTKNPKTIDFMETEGDNKGKIVLGIYELGDDTRKLCYAGPGKERPSDFSAPAGSGRVFVEFKREKN